MNLEDKLNTRCIQIRADAFYVKYYYEEHGSVQCKEAYKCRLCEKFIIDYNDLWPCTNQQHNINKCRDCAHKEYLERKSKCDFKSVN